MEFFRKYQRYFFAVIAFLIIASFSFFGAFSTFDKTVEREDVAVGKTIDGKVLMLSEVQNLARFISSDREDPVFNAVPNLCNDGVVRYDILQGRVGEMLTDEYFEELKGEFAAKFERAKKFKAYAHPDAPNLCAKAVWKRVLPELSSEVDALQNEVDARKAFGRFAKMYQLQGKLQPEVLRRVLVYQCQQFPGLRADPKLMREDLSLFGFHNASDWFGRQWVEIVAQFILNGAAAAEEKGYRVSMEEAKGDLVHHFQESVKKLGQAKLVGDLNFHAHLHSLGFDERGATVVWRKVLLFRKFFQDVGASAFIDSLAYREFNEYAKETAVLKTYRWPIELRSAQDLAEFKFYVKAVSGGNGLPNELLSVDAIEKRCPRLVQQQYRAQVAEVNKQQVGLKGTLRDVWQWQTEDKNWEVLRKQFSWPQVALREERFTHLERLDPKVRLEVDAIARDRLVDEHPEWVEEALDAVGMKEKNWVVSAGDEPVLKKKDTYMRVADLEMVGERKILSFAEARGILSELVGKVQGECSKKENPFAMASEEALANLKKNREDSRWVQNGDALSDQFKLIASNEEIQRTSEENWMKDQAFIMLPGVWSPIQVAEDGEILFFYLEERKTAPGPILQQLSFGKETLASDAKAWVAGRLLQKIKKEKAIVIPVQKEV